MPRILIFGTGAVGCVCAYILSHAGATVTCICRSTYSAISQNGITLHSHRFGTVYCRPRVMSTISEAIPPPAEPYDFILISTKSFPGSTPSLASQITPLITPNTTIALLQNGIAIESEIATAFPNNPLLSCVVYIPATQLQPGVIDCGASQKTNQCSLEIGTFPSSGVPVGHKRAAEDLASLMQKGGGDATVYHDIQPLRWSKLLVNATFNPITALTRLNTVEFLQSSPGAIPLMRSTMLEIVKVAQALGIDSMNEELAEKHLQGYLKQTVGKEPSMLVDVKNGRDFEIEVIVGNVVRIAAENGVEVPLLGALYILGKGLLEGNRKQRRECI